MRIDSQRDRKHIDNPGNPQTDAHELIGQYTQKSIPGKTDEEQLHSIATRLLRIDKLQIVGQVQNGSQDGSRKFDETPGDQKDDDCAEGRKYSGGEAYDGLYRQPAQPAGKTEPIVQEEVIELHIGLGSKDDLP